MVSTQKWCSCSDAPKDICPSVSQTWFQISLITATAVIDQSLLHTMSSFCCRTAHTWQLYKNRKSAATPIVLLQSRWVSFQVFFFSTIWGLFRASLLQPVSKEKDGESKRWKQISWGRLLSWISPSLFWKPQLLLSVDYKDQIPFFLKKKSYYHWQLQKKVTKKHDWSAPAGLQEGGKGKENHILSKTQGFGRTFDCKQASTKNGTKCKSHA